jgi:quercetin dioxygenase-like cupin family protein
VDVPTAAASYGLSPAHPEHLLVVGELVTICLPREQTGGHLSVLEVQSPVGGGVPFLHTHPGAETFIVLEGQFELYGQVDGRKTTYPAPAGTVVHVPSQAPHGYANVGDTPGRMMLVLHGDNQMEEFFHAIGTRVPDPAHPPVVDGPPDASAFAEAMCTYGLTFIEAPPF